VAGGNKHLDLAELQLFAQVMWVEKEDLLDDLR
jgi:hypothetical protein